MRYVYGYRDRPVEGIVIEPMSNGELEYILERELKKCKSTLCFPEKDLLWGPQIEIAAVETFQIYNKAGFQKDCSYK